MIPGKKYTPEDFVEIAWRRRWVILIPFILIAAGTAIWAQRLPDRYKSTAVVLVIPPQVPLNYVRPTVTEGLDRRLDTIQQEILSRARLEGLIQEFDLYPELRKEHLMEEVVAQMRRDIEVTVAKARRREDPGSFEVSYRSAEPKTAMMVADRLASLFVRRNLEARAVQAGSTTQFMESQLAGARERLREHEAKLESFRRRNAGRLPSEVNSNLQIMKSTQDEMGALNLSISQDRDRQLVIERTIADETSLGSVSVTAPGEGSSKSADDTSPAAQLAAAESQLATLSLRLKEDHPDIRILKRRIEELKKSAADEALQQPVSGRPRVVSPGDLAREKRIASLRTEFESLDRRMASKRAQVSRLQGVIDSYRARLDAAPALESEFTQLMRDYDTLEKTYSALLLKSQDAQVAANLEERQVGEQFKIIESARQPERPTSPDRFRLNMIGALIGLGIGVGFAGLLEYRDRSLRTEEDVVLTLSLPVLALVPTMVTKLERVKRQRRRFLLATSGAAFALVCLAVIAWKLQN